jgi:hypothetical protein
VPLTESRPATTDISRRVSPPFRSRSGVADRGAPARRVAVNNGGVKLVGGSVRMSNEAFATLEATPGAVVIVNLSGCPLGGVCDPVPNASSCLNGARLCAAARNPSTGWVSVLLRSQLKRGPGVTRLRSERAHLSKAVELLSIA